jgi:hypothetical protein
VVIGERFSRRCTCEIFRNILGFNYAEDGANFGAHQRTVRAHVSDGYSTCKLPAAFKMRALGAGHVRFGLGTRLDVSGQRGSWSGVEQRCAEQQRRK